MLEKANRIIIMVFDQIINLYFIFLIGFFITDYSFIFKEGVSNLSIHAMVFALLLSARWFIDRKSFSNLLFIKFAKYIIGLNNKKALFLIFLVLTLVFFFIGVARHFAFSSAGCDMGVTDQSVWNTTQGRILFSSLDGHINHLGAHFEPILFLIVQFYFVWPNILVLVILQALAIGMAVFPLYLIAKERLASRFLVFAFVFAYLFSRPLRGVGLLDFHTDAFLIPLAFVSYYLLITKRTFWAIVTMFLMLCCKESAAILIFAYGVFSITYLKRYRFGLALLVLALTWWIVATNFVMPHFANTKTYPYLKWLPFGATYTDNILAVVKNPMLIINLFFSPEKIKFYLKLFMPLAMLSFFSPQHCILFLLPLATQIIGSINHGGMIGITAHYPAHTLPFIFISAIYGAGKLIDFLKKRLSPKEWTEENISICIAVIIMVLSILFFGKSDGHKLSKFMQSAHDLESAKIRQALRIIPETASVSAVHRLVPHLTHRKYIYIFENSPGTRYLVEYVVLHRKLIELDGKQLNLLISGLKDNGFRQIYADKEEGDLFIFYNTHFNNALSEKIERKIILLN